MDRTQIVFGLGSGRCGTQSLAYLLNHQKSAQVFHEIHEHKLTWQQSEQRIEKFLAWADEQPRRQLVGDVAFAYLPYTPYLLDSVPTSKIICLQRDRTATVESYLRWREGPNHWMHHNGRDWQWDRWDQCYPKYDAASKAEAIGSYWDDYYTIATKFQATYPESFRIFATDTLNTEEGQRAILRFAGIPLAEMRLKFPLHFHQNRDTAHSWISGLREWQSGVLRVIRQRKLLD